MASAQRLLAEHQDLLEEIHLQQERSGQGAGGTPFRLATASGDGILERERQEVASHPGEWCFRAGLKRGGVTKDWSGILHTFGRDLGQSLSFLEHSLQSRPGHTPCR